MFGRLGLTRLNFGFWILDGPQIFMIIMIGYDQLLFPFGFFGKKGFY
jgi:hypothetical protein